MIFRQLSMSAEEGENTRLKLLQASTIIGTTSTLSITPFLSRSQVSMMRLATPLAPYLSVTPVPELCPTVEVVKVLAVRPAPVPREPRLLVYPPVLVTVDLVQVFSVMEGGVQAGGLLALEPLPNLSSVRQEKEEVPGLQPPTVEVVFWQVQLLEQLLLPFIVII